MDLSPGEEMAACRNQLHEAAGQRHILADAVTMSAPKEAVLLLAAPDADELAWLNIQPKDPGLRRYPAYQHQHLHGY